MGKTKNLATLLLIVSLTASILLTVEFVHGSVKPSVPEFSLTIIDESYDVPPYTNTNPYSGETWITPGYHVPNFEIQISIKNQLFTSYIENGNTISLFYKVSYKGHYEDTWRYWPDHSCPDHYIASDSEYTTVKISLLNWPELGNNDKMDFRIEARTGHYPDPNQPIEFSLIESSGWSNTQTITVYTSNSSPNPTPTSTQTTSIPTQTMTADHTQNVGQADVILGLNWEQTTIDLLSIAGIVLAITALLIISIKKERAKGSNRN